jgi:putative NADPH-quinone reductase
MEADGIIIIHPNWWGMPPAVLVGWIDRVFRPRVAYRFIEGDLGEGTSVGLLHAQSALVFNTSNTFPAREAQTFGDPLERIWKNCVLGLCGVTRVERRIFTVVVTSRPEQRKAWLEEVYDLVTLHFPPSSPLGTAALLEHSAK